MSDIQTPNEPKQIRKVCSGAHVMQWVTSSYLYYVKGNRERYWFRGKVGFCANLGCDEEKFMGDRKEYYVDKEGDPGPDNVMVKKQEVANGSAS